MIQTFLGDILLFKLGEKVAKEQVFLVDSEKMISK